MPEWSLFDFFRNEFVSNLILIACFSNQEQDDCLLSVYIVNKGWYLGWLVGDNILLRDFWCCNFSIRSYLRLPYIENTL
jgi:hypothetical protein